MKKSLLQLIFITSLLNLILFLGCKNNSGPDLDEGRIKIITITEGSYSYDYMLQIKEDQQHVISANDTLIFDNQDYRTYEIKLNELPLNCSVNGENPVTVQLKNDDEVTVVFEVNCSEPPTEAGSLEVITTTSIINSEEVYSFNFKDEQFEIGANDTVLIEVIEPGDYQLELFDLPSSCTMKSNNPQEVSISMNSTNSKKFEIFCQTVFDYKFIVKSTQFEDETHLYFLYPDGQTERITQVFGGINGPKLSPDGSKIAFTAVPPHVFEDELYLMDKDGSDIQKITEYPSDPEIYNFAWAPDGESLLFSGRTGEETSSIFSIDLDGSDLIQLTNNPDSSDVSPSWAPDGSKIVFHRRKGDFADIYLMDPDGTNVTNITNSPDRLDLHPNWIADGDKIYFISSFEDDEVTLIYDLATSQTIELIDSEGDHVRGPVWSPDGSNIAYVKPVNKEEEFDSPGYNIYVMNADGSNSKKLTEAGDLIENTSPNWSPDGTKIAFTRTDWGWGIFQPYVMNMNGTEINNLGVEGCCSIWLPLD